MAGGQGGGGGTIIESNMVQILIDNKQYVAPFRLARMQAVIAAYQATDTISNDDACFLLRCDADICDNPAA
jgi:hypothetical protein